MVCQRDPRKTNIVLFTIVALTLVMLMETRVYAQLPSATLSGTVSDASAAVIANAQLSIRNVSTGETRAVTTDASGFYSAPNLLPGKYEVTISAPGFSTQVRSGISLMVGTQQLLDITMKVGLVSQKVDVSGEASVVQLTTSDISGVVGQTSIVELPLNGRDWTQLATLQPGVDSAVSIQKCSTCFSGLERGVRGFGSQLSISGGRPNQSSYNIDGINVNDDRGTGPGSVFGATLGVDAIQEFSVLTVNASADYGRTSAGVINALTTSGTDAFHGDAYEFLRNSALDARNYFDGPQIPEFRRNQFGGSLGGPIRKHRAFFFVDYEGLRQSLGVTNANSVFSPDARNGIIHNPDGTTTMVTVDPLVKPFLALWAPPNGPLLPPGNTGIYSVVTNQTTREDFVTARFDYRFSDADSAFVSYQYDKGTLMSPDSLNDAVFGSTTKRQFVAIEETHIFNPQLLNAFRFGFNRYPANIGTSFNAINPASADPALGSVPGMNAPAIAIPGLTEFGGGLNSPTVITYALNAFQVYDDVFLTKGIHSLKFGFSFERDQLNGLEAPDPGGVFFFGSLSGFLTNQPVAYAAALPKGLSGRGFRQNVFAGYALDNMRLRPNLTVNLGLRYETSSEPTEVQGKLANLRNITDTQVHIGDPLFSNPTHWNFEPRIGLAWDPFRTGKTSVRGAFGMFDVLPLLYEYNSWQSVSAPFALVGSVAPLPPGSFPTEAFELASIPSALSVTHQQFDPKRNYVMQWNLNVQHALTPNITAMIAYVGSRGIHQYQHTDDGNIVLPTLTSAGYLWPFPAGSGTVVNPNFGSIYYGDQTGHSYYNALEVEISKRISHGLQIQGSYTWGRSIDEGSSWGSSDPFAGSISSLFWFNRRLAIGPSDYNVGQNVVINYIWAVPGAESLHGPGAWFLKGWQLGGIFEARSGLPFTPLIGGDPLGLNSGDPFAYPDRVRSSGCQSLVNPGNVNGYIKLQCFALPLATPAIAAQCTPFQPGGPGNPVAMGTCQNLLGNEGRNVVVGPGLVNFDFSVFKNTYVKEKFNVQFRAEIFNLFNHTNFAAPIDNSVLFDQTGAPVPGAGRIDSTAASSRQIQFGLKLIW